jgi:hypothetical protein
MIILYRDQQRSGNVFMEKRYRGYPPEVKKVPWMLYRREEQSAGPVLTGNELRSEMDYLRGIYPSAAKRKQVLAEEACDLLEYPGSPMYDEYPDREFLYRELLKVRERHPEETMGGTEEQDLLQVLFVNEIYRRRILNRVEN